MFKSLLNTIARISIFAISFIVFIYCKLPDQLENKRHSIKLVYEFQDAKLADGKLFSISDSIDIFFHDDYAVYQLPHRYFYYKGTMDKELNIIDDKLDRTYVKYYYVICKNKQPYGFMFDSITAVKPKKTNIDTFLKTSLCKDFAYYVKNKVKLVDSTVSNDKNILIEKRIPVKMENESFPDSIYYYYDKRFKWLNYSLSPELDSLTKSKLIKVRVIYLPWPKGEKRYGKTYPINIPRREYRFELKKIQPESKELSNFIEAFISKERMWYKTD
jgi:hypothetical protein